MLCYPIAKYISYQKSQVFCVICAIINQFAEEPCTSGTTPIISHCPTIVGEGSGTGVAVMRAMQKTNSEEESTSSCDDSPQRTNPCH